MKRLNVQMGGDWVNIECEYIKPHNNEIYVMNKNEELVGVFEVGLFDAMWISEQKGEK